jgi:hypothetical protein
VHSCLTNTLPYRTKGDYAAFLLDVHPRRGWSLADAIELVRRDCSVSHAAETPRGRRVAPDLRINRYREWLLDCDAALAYISIREVL